MFAFLPLVWVCMTACLCVCVCVFLDVQRFWSCLLMVSNPFIRQNMLHLLCCNINLYWTLHVIIMESIHSNTVYLTALLIWSPLSLSLALSPPLSLSLYLFRWISFANSLALCSVRVFRYLLLVHIRNKFGCYSLSTSPSINILIYFPVLNACHRIIDIRRCFVEHRKQIKYVKVIFIYVFMYFMCAEQYESNEAMSILAVSVRCVCVCVYEWWLIKLVAACFSIFAWIICYFRY